MNPFAQTLQDINDRLNLPQPIKSRILLEIAGDLDDLYQHHLDEGLSDDDARQRAIEMINFDDEALQELIQIHLSPFRRFWDRLSLQAQSRWEQAVLIATLCILLALFSKSILNIQFLTQASQYVWGVAGIGAFIVTDFLYHVYRLFIKRDHQPRRIRNGLSSLLFLSGIALLIGVFGFYAEALWAHNRFILHSPFLILIINAANPTMAELLPATVQWLFRSSVLMMVTMMTSILGAFAWFILTNKAQRIEQAEAALLLHAD